MSALDPSAPFTAAELVEGLRAMGSEGGAILLQALHVLVPNYIASLSSIELAEAFADETAGCERFQTAARILDDARRAKVVALCVGMGKSEEETRAFLEGAFGGAKTEVPPPVKRTRAAKTLPNVPPSNPEFLLLLLSALEQGRATAKGLAAKFRGGDVDMVRRLLSEEASQGSKARVKLEPNGRTWVRVTP